MAIIYWWLIPIIAVAFALTAWIYVRRSHKSKAVTRSVPIAHSGRLTQLSSYRRLYVQYRRIVLAIIVILGMGLAATTILAARPISENLVSPQQKNRDIMLCLDVSGSMYGVDKDILATFRSIVDNFQGQRIGLTVFNSSAVTIMPLTDDYDLLRSYLDKGQIGFNYIAKNQYSSDYTSDGYKDFRTMVDGTSANSDAGASLVGDNAVSCVNRMGNNEHHRSQSIILATDNEVSGMLIVTLPQVATYAKSKSIRMYAIDPGLSSDGSQAEHDELKQSVVSTGGIYSTTKDVSVSQIITTISKQEASLFSVAPEIVRSDKPTTFVIITLIAVAAVLIAAWRFRL